MKSSRKCLMHSLFGAKVNYNSFRHDGLKFWSYFFPIVLGWCLELMNKLWSNARSQAGELKLPCGLKCGQLSYEGTFIQALMRKWTSLKKEACSSVTRKINTGSSLKVPTATLSHAPRRAIRMAAPRQRAMFVFWGTRLLWSLHMIMKRQLFLWKHPGAEYRPTHLSWVLVLKCKTCDRGAQQIWAIIHFMFEWQ